MFFDKLVHYQSLRSTIEYNSIDKSLKALAIELSDSANSQVIK